MGYSKDKKKEKEYNKKCHIENKRRIADIQFAKTEWGICKKVSHCNVLHIKSLKVVYHLKFWLKRNKKTCYGEFY